MGTSDAPEPSNPIGGGAPGQTPPDPDEWRWLCHPAEITTREQLNEAEAANILRADYKYMQGPISTRTAPFNEPWMRRLHEEMFGDVWRWAGQYRVAQMNIGIEHWRIAESVQSLCDDLPVRRKSGMTWLEQGVLLHHRAVQIHPFRNGNGRWSRMVTNIWLRLHGRPVLVWPALIDASSAIRGVYLDAVRAADNFDYDPLTDLHRRFGG